VSQITKANNAAKQVAINQRAHSKRDQKNYIRFFFMQFRWKNKIHGTSLSLNFESSFFHPSDYNQPFD